MAKNLFLWLLIILLIVTGSMFGLELFGSPQYKPSLKFGISKDQDVVNLQKNVDEIKERLVKIEEKISEMEKNNNKTTLSNTINSNTNALLSNLTNPNPTSAPQTNATQNTNFTNCVAQNGKDEMGANATINSNLCVLNNLYTRPNTFSLNQEIVSYMEVNSDGGGKVGNSQNEIFNYKSADAGIFTLDNAKAGDKYKITGKVVNNNGSYIFESITKVERIS